jgi:phosphoglycerate dehydrogenase-like enzyme
MPRVAVLEAFDAAMQAVIRGHAGDGLELIFTASNADADRAAALATADYAVVRGVLMAPALLDAAPNLRMLHQWGTGTDHLPVAAALARGILLARSPGRNAPTVADLTLGLMLACLRRIPQSDARLRAGGWADEDLWTTGRDLTGAKVGLVGYGAIAQQVARRLAGFDCDIGYTRASGPMAGVPGFRALDDLLGWADIVSLHLPLTPATRNLLSAERLARMRPGAILINTARGGVVDEAALAACLQSGHLAAAGIDAFSAEPLPPDAALLSAPNTVLSPHVAGRTADNLRRMVQHWAANIRTHAAGGQIDPGDLVT